MKLEYLADGSPDCPLIRLYDFTAAEADQLRAVIADLASGAFERAEVHLLPGVEAVNGCRLTVRVQKWDQAIIRLPGAANFRCGFTAGTWDNVAGLIEPFARGASGLQWLAGVPGEAQLLLSTNGQW
jgi:hypothetical protein